MNQVYRVAIHFNEDCGYLEYDEKAKTVQVVLQTEEKRAEVETYLTQEHSIYVPHDTLMDFSATTVTPLANLANFKLALTRLWGVTAVYVDWSRPVNV